jgi:hypothetical protein
MYWANFKRALGFRHGFRRSGGSSYINIAVAAGVGVVSGHYIFKQPLEDYWSEENQKNRNLLPEQQQPPPPPQEQQDKSRSSSE